MSFRSGLAKFQYYAGKYFVVAVSLVLLAFALYFYVGAERFRRQLRKKHSHLFYNDDLVTITDVLDGDEMKVVKKGGKSTLLRLLGVKAFDPDANVFLFPRYGKMAIKHVKDRFIGLRGRIQLGKTKTDPKGRLLATLYFPQKGSDKYTIDVGLTLIRAGLAIVYIKYPFELQTAYLRAEKEAREQRRGLWGNTEASKMAMALKSMWAKEVD